MRPLRLSELTGKPRRKPGTDTAERLYYWQISQAGLEIPDQQYFFAQAELGREWRFDFSWRRLKVGVEIQGGVWTRGAHGHPLDILRNMEKHNDAALLGWRIMQFTPDQVKTGEALLFTELVLKGILPSASIIHIKQGKARGTKRSRNGGLPGVRAAIRAGA